MCCFDVKNAEKMSHITRNKNVLCVCSAHQHWSNKYVPMVKLDKSQTKYYTHSSTHTLDTRHKYTRCMLAGPTQYSSRHSCIPSAVFVLNWIGHNELQKKNTHTHTSLWYISCIMNICECAKSVPINGIYGPFQGNPPLSLFYTPLSLHLCRYIYIYIFV